MAARFPAQQPWGRPLIALLSPVSAATATRNIAGFRNGLRDLGLIEGRNIFLALRFAGGMAERMPALARELIDLKPDVLIAAPESSLAAVRALTTTVPILTIWMRDPVLTGTVRASRILAKTSPEPGSPATMAWWASASNS